jgi:hypothetical protein
MEAFEKDPKLPEVKFYCYNISESITMNCDMSEVGVLSCTYVRVPGAGLHFDNGG